MDVRIAVVIALAVMVEGAIAQPAACPSTSPEVACTAQGAVRGVADGSLLAFKGIPYAKPPVGSLRWRPPEASAAWSGVRDGGRFGAMCPQFVGTEVKGDEDCLYLNVWRPRTPAAAPLPVMVWLTGGGNHALSGEGTGGFGGLAYSGAMLVPEGLVFVSYNLRLGALGFLAHAALDAERSERISGNYGSLDQIAMLSWIKVNIAAFGGDPDKVFLFGTSAGGGNICALLTSPLTKGLIHGVAMQSSVPMGCEIQTLADAQNGTGRRIVAATGCDKGPPAEIAACLRAKSATEIVTAAPGTFTVLPRLYGPNVDGHVFPDQPLKRIVEGKAPPVPVIIGNTSEETLGWANTAGPVTDDASYAAALERVFGAAARERILAQYPASAFASPRLAFAQATTDAEFTCQSRRVARAFAKAQKPPVFRYFFAHAQENDPALKANGAGHTVEHAYLFPGRGTYAMTDADRAVQRLMIGYWTRMAKAGDPNGGDAPRWPAATDDDDAYLEIGAVTVARKGAAQAKCDFWDGIAFPWPHL